MRPDGDDPAPPSASTCAPHQRYSVIVNEEMRILPRHASTLVLRAMRAREEEAREGVRR